MFCPGVGDEGPARSTKINRISLVSENGIISYCIQVLQGIIYKKILQNHLSNFEELTLHRPNGGPGTFLHWHKRAKIACDPPNLRVRVATIWHLHGQYQ